MRTRERGRGTARPAAILLVAAAGLSGCGQTGPLYLPDYGSTTVITRPGPATTGAATTGNEAAAPPASTAADAPAAAPATPTDKPPDKPPAKR
jgi:predicted small lipoprotein YifL